MKMFQENLKYVQVYKRQHTKGRQGLYDFDDDLDEEYVEFCAFERKTTTTSK